MEKVGLVEHKAFHRISVVFATSSWFTATIGICISRVAIPFAWTGMLGIPGLHGIWYQRRIIIRHISYCVYLASTGRSCNWREVCVGDWLVLRVLWCSAVWLGRTWFRGSHQGWPYNLLTLMVNSDELRWSLWVDPEQPSTEEGEERGER